MKENKDLIDSVENKYIDQIKYHQDDITGYKKSFEWLNSCLDNLAKFYNIRYTTDALKEAGVNEAGESVIRDLINHTIQALIDFREVTDPGLLNGLCRDLTPLLMTIYTLQVLDVFQVVLVWLRN